MAIVRMAKYNSSSIVHDENSGQCFKHGVNADGTQQEPVIRDGFDWSESLQVSEHQGYV